MDLSEYRHAGETPHQRHPWEQARLSFVESIIENCFSSAPENADTLDVGCGDAFVSSCLARRFPHRNFVGYDPEMNAEQMLSLSKAHGCENLKLVNSISNDQPDDFNFRIVLLLDVLEHVEEDFHFFDGLVKNPSIKRGAFFLVTVPAFGGLFGHHDEILGHVRRYDLRRLERISLAAGCEIVKTGYFFLLPLFLRAIENVLERVGLISKKQKTRVSCWKGGPKITKLLSSILRFDLSVTRAAEKIGLKIPGLSCYMICRKPA